MNLVRSVLSYSLLIIIVVIAVLAYQYREQVIPEVRSVWQDARALVTGKGAPGGEAESQEAAQAALPEPAPAVTGGPEPAGPESTGQVATGSSDNAAAATAVPQGKEESGQVEEAPLSETPSTAATMAATAEPVPETAVEHPPVVKYEPLAESQPETKPETAGLKQNIPEPATDTGSAEEALASVRESVPQPDAATATDHQVANRDESISPPASPAPARTPVAAPVVPADSSPPQPEPAATLEAELLQQARQAYWARNFDAAVTAYQKLLEADPENPDLYGELGNVYYSMGEWQKAGQAYYEAAQRLLARGQTQQLGYLLHVIEGLDRELADKLRKQIETHSS